MVWLAVEFAYVVYSTTHCENGYLICNESLFRNYMELLGWVAGSYYSVLTASLVYYHFQLKKTLETVL